MPLVDIRKQKRTLDALSIQSVNDTIIPLATDLQNLPGHSQDEIRDIRFLNYIDCDTLANHFSTCLYVDKNSFSPTKQYIFKSRYNALNRIFKFYFIKTFRRNLAMDKKSIFNKKDQQKQQPLSIISSPTAKAFQMDWSVNQRNSSSTHRKKPKNLFHILQLKPKTQLSVTNETSISPSPTPIQRFERVKDILARTYYPHLHTAIEYGYEFGSKSNILHTQELISTHDEIPSIKEMPQSPIINNDPLTITLKSPPSAPIKPMATTPKTKSKSASTITIENPINGYTDDLSSFIIKPSFVVLTPARLPLPSPPPTTALSDTEKEVNNNNHNNRKRKSSSSTSNITVIERKKKRIISSPSLNTTNHYENISDPER